MLFGVPKRRNSVAILLKPSETSYETFIVHLTPKPETYSAMNHQLVQYCEYCRGGDGDGRCLSKLSPFLVRFRLNTRNHFVSSHAEF